MNLLSQDSALVAISVSQAAEAFNTSNGVFHSNSEGTNDLISSLLFRSQRMVLTAFVGDHHLQAGVVAQTMPTKPKSTQTHTSSGMISRNPVCLKR